jgi:DNA-binding MarR family transcriptional regulator
MCPTPGPGHGAQDPTTGRALTALVQLLASVEAIEVRRWGDLGLTISQLRVLHLLHERPASCGQVAEHLGITPSTATALIERLVRRELIERTPHEGDRRITDLRLSPRGRDLLEETGRGQRGVIKPSIEALAAPDRERLADLLERLAGSVQALEAESPAPEFKPSLAVTNGSGAAQEVSR